jgi:hypothetical protein
MGSLIATCALVSAFGLGWWANRVWTRFQTGLDGVLADIDKDRQLCHNDK